jgi:hypothetical protein
MSDAAQPVADGAGRPSRAWLAGLGLATLFGAALRLDQIRGQLIGDDELHSLQAVRDETLAWILTHFGVADHCIPLTALDWILSRTVGLSETGMRCLPLAAGIGAIPLLALLLRREIGGRASLIFALLLALAPLEVFYSRMARPYEPVFLLCFVALLALRRWSAGGARAWAGVYVASSALAVWFQLVVAPFVLAPLCLCLLPRGAPARGRAEIACLCVCLGLGVALLVGPALLADLSTLCQRAFGRAEPWPDGEVCFQLLSGSFRPPCSFVFALALLVGLLELRRRGAFALWLLVPGLLQFLLPLLARPAGLGQAIILVRYALPAHGPLLVLAALGLARLDDLARIELPHLPRHVSTLGLAALLYFAGPLPWIHERPNNWTNHLVYQGSYARTFFYLFARGPLGLQGIPPVYARIAREARPGDVLVEAPWFGAAQFVPYPIFQRTHHLPYLVGFVTPAQDKLCWGELRAHDPRFRFANFVHVGELDLLRARHVRFVLLHRKRPPVLNDDWHVDLRHVETWIARYKELVGAPYFEDAELCVFDLAPPPGAPPGR